MTASKIANRLLLVLLAAIVVWSAVGLIERLAAQRARIAVPTAQVQRGDVTIVTYARGELRPARAATLSAPNLLGPVRITELVTEGSVVRKGDLIAAFDAADLNADLEEKRLAMQQLDEQLKKAEADQAIRKTQEQVDLLSARYAVKRAELEMRRNPLLPAADAAKNQMSLEEAKRKLMQLESDVKARDEQSQNELTILHEKKEQSAAELSRGTARLSQAKLFAPMGGLVAIQQNGTQPGRLRIGDQLNPGAPVAEVLDLSEFVVVAQVDDFDRANLEEGEKATIQLDAVPARKLEARIASLPAKGAADPAKRYEVVFSVDTKQLEDVLEPLRPGLLAGVEIFGGRLHDAVHVPAQAVFEKNGSLVAYVKKDDKFEARPVTAGKRTESVMVVASGLQPGEVIALSDPTRNRKNR